MKFRPIYLWLAVLGATLFTVCSTQKTVADATPVGAPPPPAALAPAVVTSPPVKTPPLPGNGVLPDTILAWDSELKSIDVPESQDQGHLFFSFTNVSPADVTILNVHPGCGCTTAQLPDLPWTIVPGTNGQIGVTINVHGKIGTLFKNLTVTTDKGVKSLNFRVNMVPVVLPQMTDDQRASNVKISQADRQAVFKPDCATCHVAQGVGKYGKRLYDADCAICHDAEHRATMVPDLRALKVPTNTEFWRTWIAHGKPGTLMPAFSTSDGGPLDDMQIATIAVYLNMAIPSPAANK